MIGNGKPRRGEPIGGLYQADNWAAIYKACKVKLVCSELMLLATTISSLISCHTYTRATISYQACCHPKPGPTIFDLDPEYR